MSVQSKDPGSKQLDCTDAQKYDLGYVRVASDNPIAGTLLSNPEYNDYSLVIQYDSSVQSNPPKGFK